MPGYKERGSEGIGTDPLVDTLDFGCRVGGLNTEKGEGSSEGSKQGGRGTRVASQDQPVGGRGGEVRAGALRVTVLKRWNPVPVHTAQSIKSSVTDSQPSSAQPA